MVLRGAIGVVARGEGGGGGLCGFNGGRRDMAHSPPSGHVRVSRLFELEQAIEETLCRTMAERTQSRI